MVRQSFAPFPAGPLVRGAGAGALLPQLEATGPDGATGRVDDLLGTGFGVVVAGCDVAGDEDRAFWTALDTRIVTAGPRLGEWLAAQGARAALVRPDRVILALAPRADLAVWRGDARGRGRRRRAVTLTTDAAGTRGRPGRRPGRPVPDRSGTLRGLTPVQREERAREVRGIRVAERVRDVGDLAAPDRAASAPRPAVAPRRRGRRR